MSSTGAQSKTAFIFAGGGSFGAIQVGMLHALAAHGVTADMVFGSSVGALNAAYYAGNPTVEGVKQLETIWRGLRRRDIFQVTWRTVFGFMRRRDFLATSDGLSLTKSFMRIKSGKLRRRIVDLVEQIAGDE